MVKPTHEHSDRRLRIGVDVRPLAVSVFGIGRYTRELLDRAIPASAGDIDWYLYCDRPTSVVYREPNVRHRDYPRARQALSLFRTQVVFSFWARRDRLDVFWSPRHHLPLALPRRTKAVLTIHDLVWRHYPETMLPRNRFVERALMPRSVSRADRILCVSGATERDLLDALPEAAGKTRVVWEGAQKMSGGATAATPDEDFMLFVGTLEPRKNLRNILKAIESCRERGLPCLRLVVVGAGGWETDLTAWIAELGLEEWTDVRGHVDDVELHSLYRAARFLVCPSLYEGFGLPALEAMQYGTPVIGANRSSLPEVIGPGGLLVDPERPVEIADAIARLTQDPGLRAELGERGKSQAARFSWDEATSQTLDALTTVARPREARSDEARPGEARPGEARPTPTGRREP